MHYDRNILLYFVLPIASFPFRESPDRGKGVFTNLHLSVLSDISLASGEIVMNNDFLTSFFQSLHRIMLFKKRVHVTQLLFIRQIKQNIRIAW